MAERGRPRGFDREQVLRRAMEVFWEHGYEGASLTELTTAMGINAPSLYAAFGCKEALFREAVALYNRTEGISVYGALTASTAREAIAGLLRDAAGAYTGPGRPTGCMVVLAATTYTSKTVAVRDFLAEQRQRSTAELRARLDRGVADGELAPHTDTAALASYVSTVVYGMSLQARDGATREELIVVADAAMAGWEALVSGRPRTPEDGATASVHGWQSTSG